MREIKLKAYRKSLKKQVSATHVVAFDFHVDGHFSVISLDPDVALCRSTGLHDKNGKEIWEGNVVKESGCVWTVDFLDGAFRLDNRIWLSLAYSTCEVIGNIYENPELLTNQN